MKKILKSKILYFFLGVIIISCGTVFAYSLLASNTSYTPKDINWNVDNVEGAINDLHKKAIKCSGTTWNFNFSSDEQVFEVPNSGTYILEVWGAQGGSVNNDFLGGYGSYSIGTVSLNEGEKLYVNVGGTGNEYTGGYNGGGNGGFASTRDLNGGYQYGYGGGGATSISRQSGLLKTQQNSINNILIVAGGGAGSGISTIGAYGGSGGHAGGATGETGYDTSLNSYSGYNATGGTQTSGGYSLQNSSYKGSFGQGSNCHDVGYGGSGGGGGFYGGGGSSRAHGGAGGGSGYIGNSLLSNKKMVMYSTKSSYVNVNENTKTEITTLVSEEPKTNYVKKGNGHAKITFIVDE